MTAQSYERLLFEGKEYGMADEPLYFYLQKRKDIQFTRPTTACWRGYYGRWEIRDNKLFLVDLEAYLPGFTVVGIDYVFSKPGPIFADWFSRDIRIPMGELLEYVHMGYSSTYEKDMFLEFQNGVLINRTVVDNHEDYLKRKAEGKSRRYVFIEEEKEVVEVKKTFWQRLFGK